MKNFTLFTLSLLITTIGYSQCSDNRYRDFNYFDGSNKTSGITFGSNTAVGTGANQVLKMDIYEPEGDVATNRAVVVVAFGGSFIGGVRGDVEALCREFARLGYVAVAPDYRVGIFFPINEVNTTLAVLRGSHDMKACVRYLRKTAEEDGNPYGIDPDMIMIGGVSAGAISAIHAAYLNDNSEVPEYMENDTAGLGGMEGNSGSPAYSSVSQGVFSFSGAIGDTSWIIPGDIPIISFHEEQDGVVPYNTEEVAVSGFPTGLIASGSSDLHLRAAHIGMDNCFTGYPGNGHVGFLNNGNYAEVMGRTADFLADIVCAESMDCGEVVYTEDTTSNTSINELSTLKLNVYPNPTTGSMTLVADHWNKEAATWYLTDAQGRTVLTGRLTGKRETIDIEGITPGYYSIRWVGTTTIGSVPLIVQ